MRRFLILAGPIAVASFAFACEDDPLNNPGTNFPEAGAFDGARPPTPDSSTPDAAPDGDATLPPPPVTVVVANRKGPRAGIVVVFHDATGAILETKTTDATGRATSNAAGPIPVMASALLGKDFGFRRQILTWTGVEAGDELIAADPESGDAVGSFSITLPSLLADAGGSAATNYTANLGECYANNDGTVPIDLFVSTTCTGPQNAPIVTATDDFGTVLGFAFKKNVAPPTDGGIVNVGALTGWTAVSTFKVTVQNPPGINPLNANLLEIANNVATSNSTVYSFTNNDAVFKVAPGYADAYQARIRYADAGKIRTLNTRLAASATQATFDFQQALPEITDATVDGSDKKRPSVTWTAASTLAGTDGGYLRTTFFFENEDRTKWTFIVPPGATTGTVKAPILPAAESALFLPDPASGSQAIWDFPEAVFAEADALADYKAFRKLQGIVNQVEGTPAGFLPTNGSFKTTEKRPNLQQ